ncbi:MAG: S24 family peptidase, partial [Croceimicrobium sp.]
YRTKSQKNLEWQSGTLRIFQIEGDSMLPVQPGAYVIGEFVENWETLKNNGCYILLTLNDGIVYKRVENELNAKNRLLLKSDNTDYKPYYLDALEVLEVWKAKGILSFQMPNENDLKDQQYQRMLQGINDLKDELSQLKSRIGD